jgi:hypothetical protein
MLRLRATVQGKPIDPMLSLEPAGSFGTEEASRSSG